MGVQAGFASNYNSLSRDEREALKKLGVDVDRFGLLEATEAGEVPAAGGEEADAADGTGPVPRDGRHRDDA